MADMCLAIVSQHLCTFSCWIFLVLITDGIAIPLLRNQEEPEHQTVLGKRREPNNVQCFKNSDCISDCCISSDGRSGVCVGKPMVGQICGLFVSGMAPSSMQRPSQSSPSAPSFQTLIGTGGQTGSDQNRGMDLQQLLGMVHSGHSAGHMVPMQTNGQLGASDQSGSIIQGSIPGGYPNYLGGTIQQPQQQQPQNGYLSANFNPSASNFLQQLNANAFNYG